VCGCGYGRESKDLSLRNLERSRWGVLGMEFLFETFEVMVRLPSATRWLGQYWTLSVMQPERIMLVWREVE